MLRGIVYRIRRRVKNPGLLVWLLLFIGGVSYALWQQRNLSENNRGLIRDLCTLAQTNADINMSQNQRLENIIRTVQAVRPGGDALDLTFQTALANMKIENDRLRTERPSGCATAPPIEQGK